MTETGSRFGDPGASDNQAAGTGQASHAPDVKRPSANGSLESSVEHPDDIVARLRYSLVQEQERQARRLAEAAERRRPGSSREPDAQAPREPAASGPGVRPLVTVLGVIVIVGILAVGGLGLFLSATNPAGRVEAGRSASSPTVSSSQPIGIPQTSVAVAPSPTVVATVPVVTNSSPPLVPTRAAVGELAQSGPSLVGSYGWTASGSFLENDGSDFGGANWLNGLWNTHWISAPATMQPTEADYVVEAEIIVRERPSCGSFGLVIRGTIQVGVHDCQAGATPFVSIRSSTPALLDNAYLAAPFDPASDWHRYRVEVRGDRLNVAIDGVAVADVAGLPADQLDGPVGLWDDHTALSVRAFRVLPAPPR